jgi:hypothetical protein
VSSLATLVTSLASSVEGAAVGSGAVPRDVAKLSAGIALHGLGLAISGEMVGATALVAGGRSRTTGESTAAAESTSESATTDGGSTGTTTTTTAAHTGTSRVGARSSQVAWLATVVATTAGSSTAQAESRAVSLDVAEALAVVALLGLGGPGQGALVGLVSLIMSAVAQLDDRVHTYLAACSCSKDAQQRSRLRHSGQHCHTCNMRDARETTWRLVYQSVHFHRQHAYSRRFAPHLQQFVTWGPVCRGVVVGPR